MVRRVVSLRSRGVPAIGSSGGLKKVTPGDAAPLPPVFKENPAVASWAAHNQINPDNLVVEKLGAGSYYVRDNSTNTVYRITSDGKYVVEENFGGARKAPANAAQMRDQYPETIGNARSFTNANDLSSAAASPELTGISGRTAWDLDSIADAVAWLDDAFDRANRLTHFMPEIMEKVGEYPSFSFGMFPAGKIAYQRHRNIYYNVRGEIAGIAHELRTAAEVTRQVAKNYAATEQRNQLNVAQLTKLFNDASAQFPASPTTSPTAASTGPADSPRSSPTASPPPAGGGNAKGAYG